MPLIRCPRCGHLADDVAAACPSCGASLASRVRGRWVVLLVATFMALLLGALLVWAPTP